MDLPSSSMRSHRVRRIIELSLHPLRALKPKPACQSCRNDSENFSSFSRMMQDSILYSWFSNPIHLYRVGSLADPLCLKSIVNLVSAKFFGIPVDSVVHMWHISLYSSSRRRGLYLNSSAGIPCGPTALSSDIFCVALSNQKR